MTARECTRALADIRSARDPGMRSWLAGAVDAIHVEAIVVAMHTMALWARLRRAVGGWLAPGSGSGGGGGSISSSGGGGVDKTGGGGNGGDEGDEDSGLPPLQKLPAEFVAATARSSGVAAA
jgi:hypothetical protein